MRLFVWCLLAVARGAQSQGGGAHRCLLFPSRYRSSNGCRSWLGSFWQGAELPEASRARQVSRLMSGWLVDAQRPARLSRCPSGPDAALSAKLYSCAFGKGPCLLCPQSKRYSGRSHSRRRENSVFSQKTGTFVSRSLSTRPRCQYEGVHTNSEDNYRWRMRALPRSMPDDPSQSLA